MSKYQVWVTFTNGMYLNIEAKNSDEAAEIALKNADPSLLNNNNWEIEVTVD